MRSFLTISSRQIRRLALIATIALAATVVNAVPAAADPATKLTIDNVDTSMTAVREGDAITVTGRDDSNAEDTGYAAGVPVTVTFSADCGDCFTISPNNGEGAPKSYTFGLLTDGASGHKDFTLTWKESAAIVGTRTLTVSEGGLTPGQASGITVLSNAPAILDWGSGPQTGAQATVAESLTITLNNPQNQTNPNPYTGTVTFSAIDDAAPCVCFTITPNNGGGNSDKYTFVAGDNSSKIFQLAWTTAGTDRSFTATGSDLGTTPSKTQTGINVQTAPPTTTTSTSTTTTTTLPPRVAEPMIVTAAGAGGGPHVIARAADNGAVVMSFYAYDPAFTGGVRVATGDVNNDGFDDIITAAGPGGGPHIKVFSGKTGVLFASFFAYAPTFTGGVFVAAGDVNNDGRADVITGADAGGGPHVRVFDATKLAGPPDDAQLLGFFAYQPAFHGGVRVAAGDFNNDNKADIVTAPGAGGGPHIIVVNGVNGSIIGQFMAYGGNFTGGVFVAADQGGEGLVYTGAGPGGGEHVRVLNLAGAEQLGFMASPATNGAVPAIGDSTSAASDLLLVSSYLNSPTVRSFDFETGAFAGGFPAYGAGIGVFTAVGIL